MNLLKQNTILLRRGSDNTEKRFFMSKPTWMAGAIMFANGSDLFVVQLGSNEPERIAARQPELIPEFRIKSRTNHDNN